MSGNETEDTFSFEHTLNDKRERIPGLTRHQAQWAQRISATGKRYLLSDDPLERDRDRHVVHQAEAYVVRIAFLKGQF
jgi:predicted SprT family Zn-dependent metalloprotease